MLAVSIAFNSLPGVLLRQDPFRGLAFVAIIIAIFNCFAGSWGVVFGSIINQSKYEFLTADPVFLFFLLLLLFLLLTCIDCDVQRPPPHHPISHFESEDEMSKQQKFSTFVFV